MKNNKGITNKGITLISLVITVMVLLILAGITVNYGIESIQNAKIESLKTNMLLIKAKAMEYVEQANFKAGTSGTVNDEIKKELKGVEITESYPSYISLENGQYLYNVNGELENMGLKDIEIDANKNEMYLVKYDIKNATVEVYNTVGVNSKNGVVYDLTTLKQQ